jgi:hypothetical protein
MNLNRCCITSGLDNNLFCFTVEMEILRNLGEILDECL